MTANLLEAFATHLRERPDAPALVVPQHDNAETFTWSQLAAMAVAVAENLSGQRIGCASDNSLLDVILPLACMASGRIEVPFDDRLPDSCSRFDKLVGGQWLTSADRTRLSELALQSQPTAGDLQRLQKAAAQLDPNQPSLILWTSGTTSQPKGVTLSQRNLLGNAAAKLGAVPQDQDDVRLTCLPLCHAYARTCDFGTWLISGSVLAVGRGLSAWEELSELVRPTLANVVPSIASALLESDPQQTALERLRLLGCGGAAISDADFSAWQQRGVTVIQGYGLTETSPVICSATPETAVPGFVGPFVDGWESELRDGRLLVRGLHVMIGYWNDPAATEARIDKHGWLDTGDIVQFDSASRQLRILGRSDEVIVLSDGHKVHPQSIEREIQSIVGVRHALVVPNGRRIAVWVDAENTFDQQQLQDQIISALSHRPAWEQPDRIGCFDTPLSQKSGELTAKGAIRRQRVLACRGLMPTGS